MRVSRSLTIKQMAMVAGVSMAFVLVFCSILLFHFVQQSRFITATQLESIARSVREPLSAAILKADIPEAEAILGRIQPAGIVSRADVVLPNQFQALRMRFIPERPVPVMVTRVFELPVQISCRFTPGEASQPAADSLSGAAGRLLADLQIRHERTFYVSDCLLLAGAYSDGGYHMVYQPSDRPSAA